MTGQAAVMLALLAIAGPVAAQPAGVGTGVDKLRVGVLDLSGSALKTQTAVIAAGGPGGYTQQSTTTVALPPPAEFARGLTEMLTTTLVATNRFVVLERAQVGAVMQEQDLGASGRVAGETAPAQGGVIGAQALITGDITGFSYSSEALGGNLANVIRGVTAGASRVTAVVVLDLRLVDAVTGEVLGSASGRGKASATGVSADLTKGERTINAEGAKATPLGEASRAAIRNAVAELLRQAPKALAWARRVVDVRDGLVYVNSGRGDGLEPGTILQAFEQAQALIDPDTGRNLGNPDRLLGELQVEAVEERYSVAKVLSGQGFARNHLVRIKPR